MAPIGDKGIHTREEGKKKTDVCLLFERRISAHTLKKAFDDRNHLAADRRFE
jgi:hypothetical protein